MNLPADPPLRLDPGTSLGPYSESGFAATAEAFNRLYGLVPAPHHLHAIFEPLFAQAREKEFVRLEDYLRSLFERKEAEDALAVFIPRLTVQESYFFRFVEQLNLLPDQVREAIESGACPNPVVWVAGCSTGEECYSLVMLLHDRLDRDQFERVRFLASDINPEALAFARRARYGYWSFRNMPDELMDRFFTHVEGTFEVKPFVRERVRLIKSNLNTPESWPVGSNEVNFLYCRNVLIYFDKASIRRVLEGFQHVLSPAGSLFLGHSESIWEADDLYQVVVTPQAFYYRSRKSPAGRTSAPVETAADEAARIMAKWRAAASDTPVPDSSPVRSGATARPPEYWRGLLQTAVRQVNRGDLQEAARGFFECLMSEETEVPGHLGLSFVDIQRGRTLEAWMRIEEVLKADDLASIGYYLRGLIRQARNDRDGAITDFKRALFLDPLLALARVHLATQLESRGRRIEAKREYNQAVELLQSGRPTDLFWGEASRESLLEYGLGRIKALGR